MKNDKMFQISALCCLYLVIKERKGTIHEEFIKHKEQIVKEVYNNLKKEDLFLHVLDKISFIEKMTDDIEQCFKYNKFLESLFFKQLESNLQDFEDTDKRKIFDIVIKKAFADKIITDEEKEVVYQLAQHLNLDIDNINKYLIDSKKKIKKDISKNDVNKRNSFSLIMLLSSVLFIAAAIALIAYSQLFSKKSKITKLKLSNIVYQKIYFDKYIVAGNCYAGDTQENNSATGQKLLGKAIVFYVHGYADVEFQFDKFKLEDNKLVYFGTLPEGFDEILPFSIDVNIQQSDISEVFEKKPHKITPSEASSIGKYVAIASAGGGAYLGGKIGSTLGASVIKFFPIGRAGKISDLAGALIGGGAGAIFGGGAAGAAGYIASKKFLTGVQITKNITLSDKDKILEKTKALIAANILYDKSLQKDFIDSFEQYVKNLYLSYGIEINEIVYSSAEGE